MSDKELLKLLLQFFFRRVEVCFFENYFAYSSYVPQAILNPRGSCYITQKALCFVCDERLLLAF